MPPVSPMLAKSVTVDPAGRVVRAQVGRVPVDLFPRRRRGGARQPQREADDPVLPRVGRGGHRRAAGALRDRRRDRHRHRPRPGFRGAAAAHPPGRFAGAHARRADAGVVHRLRPAGPRRRRLHRPAVRRAPRRTGRRAGRRRARRSTSRRRPPIWRPRSAGSTSSRAPVSTA